MYRNLDNTTIYAEFNKIIRKNELSSIVPFLATYKKDNENQLKIALNQAYQNYLHHQKLNENQLCCRWDKYQQATCKTMFGMAMGLLSVSDLNERWHFFLKYCIHRLFIHTTETFNIITTFNTKPIFNTLINTHSYLPYWSLKYLEEHHLIDRNPNAIATALAQAPLPSTIFNYYYENPLPLNEYRKRFLALNIPTEDLVCLFEYKNGLCNIHHNGIRIPKNANGYISFNYIANNGGIWAYFIPKYIEQGKLDKQFVLQKCIEIQTSDWHKNNKKFCKELFYQLNPSHYELLAIQHSLFALLDNTLNANIDFAITMLKEIISHPNFNHQPFLNAITPLTAQSTSKATAKKLLSLLDQLRKQGLILPQHICSSLFYFTAHTDGEIQERANHLLAKI